MSQDHEQHYSVGVWSAYRELAKQYQTPDVPIHAIHGRVGGSIHELHEFLRAECLAHRAVPSTGEPAFAGDAARQSALTLPGEKETFLNIKLLGSSMGDNQQQAESPAQEYERLMRRLYELKYPERTPELEEKIEESLRNKVKTFRQEHELREKATAYERSLRQDLAQRHPDLTPEQAQRYEARIQEPLRDHKAALTRHQPQTPACWNQQQEQGRGIER